MRRHLLLACFVLAQTLSLRASPPRAAPLSSRMPKTKKGRIQPKGAGKSAKTAPMQSARKTCCAIINDTPCGAAGDVTIRADVLADAERHGLSFNLGIQFKGSTWVCGTHGCAILAGVHTRLMPSNAVSRTDLGLSHTCWLLEKLGLRRSDPNGTAKRAEWEHMLSEDYQPTDAHMALEDESSTSSPEPGRSRTLVRLFGAAQAFIPEDSLYNAFLESGFCQVLAMNGHSDIVRDIIGTAYHSATDPGTELRKYVGAFPGTFNESTLAVLNGPRGMGEGSGGSHTFIDPNDPGAAVRRAHLLGFQSYNTYRGDKPALSDAVIKPTEESAAVFAAAVAARQYRVALAKSRETGEPDPAYVPGRLLFPSAVALSLDYTDAGKSSLVTDEILLVADDLKSGALLGMTSTVQADGTINTGIITADEYAKKMTDALEGVDVGTGTRRLGVTTVIAHEAEGTRFLLAVIAGTADTPTSYPAIVREAQRLLFPHGLFVIAASTDGGASAPIRKFCENGPQTLPPVDEIATFDQLPVYYALDMAEHHKYWLKGEKCVSDGARGTYTATAMFYNVMGCEVDAKTGNVVASPIGTVDKMTVRGVPVLDILGGDMGATVALQRRMIKRCGTGVVDPKTQASQPWIDMASTHEDWLLLKEPEFAADLRAYGQTVLAARSTDLDGNRLVSLGELVEQMETGVKRLLAGQAHAVAKGRKNTAGSRTPAGGVSNEHAHNVETTLKTLKHWQIACAQLDVNPKAGFGFSSYNEYAHAAMKIRNKYLDSATLPRFVLTMQRAISLRANAVMYYDMDTLKGGKNRAYTKRAAAQQEIRRRSDAAARGESALDLVMDDLPKHVTRREAARRAVVGGDSMAALGDVALNLTTEADLAGVSLRAIVSLGAKVHSTESRRRLALTAVAAAPSLLLAAHKVRAYTVELQRVALVVDGTKAASFDRSTENNRWVRLLVKPLDNTVSIESTTRSQPGAPLLTDVLTVPMHNIIAGVFDTDFGAGASVNGASGIGLVIVEAAATCGSISECARTTILQANIHTGDYSALASIANTPGLTTAVVEASAAPGTIPSPRAIFAAAAVGSALKLDASWFQGSGRVSAEFETTSLSERMGYGWADARPEGFGTEFRGLQRIKDQVEEHSAHDGGGELATLLGSVYDIENLDAASVNAAKALEALRIHAAAATDLSVGMTVYARLPKEFQDSGHPEVNIYRMVVVNSSPQSACLCWRGL